MRKPITFFELQLEQKIHDQRNHSDIYSLPMFSKINHYVLHFTKYAARLALKKSEEETIAELKRTYVDAFLISLAASNALNLDLDLELRRIFKKVPSNIKEFVTSSKKITLNELQEYSKNTLILASGSMADTLEKRDHLDDKDSKVILKEGVLKIISALLFGSYHLNLDLVESTLNRRRVIAELKIT